MGSPLAYASGDSDESVQVVVRRNPDAELGAVGRGTPGSATTVNYLWEFPLRSPPQVDHSLSPIGRANQAIVAAGSADLELTERSNAFDLWMSLLEEASENALQRSAYFRQVLGVLLTAVRKRDVTDFSPEELTSLQTVTNILHSPSVVEADTGRAARLLASMRPQLPMFRAAATGEGGPSGEDLLEQLLAKQ